LLFVFSPLFGAELGVNMIIYVFGNEFLEEDNFAGKVAGNLDGEIVFCRSPEDLLEAVDKQIIILDVVKNIKEPMIIDDIKKLKVNNLMSLHDFDLAYFLNVMESIGEGLKIKIIGVPSHGDAEKVALKVKKWI